MKTSAIIFLGTIISIFLWGIFFEGDLPRRYRARSCQGKLWKRMFPSASNEEIREFLLTFTDAFAFSRKEKLKLNPDDTILQIYRALYPSKWMADALEVETLAADIESKYGVKFDAIWHDKLTLGELFAKSRPGARP